jgi:hypothetical protein
MKRLLLLLVMTTNSWAGHPSLAPVERQLEAYNRQDVDAFVACFAPNVRIHREEDGSVSEGREAMRERYAAMFAKYPRNRCTILNRIVCGEHVVDEELIEGRDDQPFRTVAVYRVKDGMITEVRFLSRDSTVGRR